MKNQFLLFLLLMISFSGIAQPYGGTIFVDADIITSSDSSALESVSYTGRGFKTIFDRRVNTWTTVNAFLFEVIWNDGLNSEAVINPEFGTVESAEIEAKKYAWSIGQLPHCLRIDVDEIWINKGVQPFGGGNQSILIHTGQTILYENDGILEETLVHEASHTSLDAQHAAASGWLAAQNLDGGFISDYAEDFPSREDIAESFLLWLAVRYRADNISTQDYNLITNAIPNRLNYFDDIVCDLFPFEVENTTSVNELEQAEKDVVVYPNPTTDLVHLKLNDDDSYQAIIYNALGDAVLSNLVRNNENIDLSAFPNGVYFLVLHKDGKQMEQRIIKY